MEATVSESQNPSCEIALNEIVATGQLGNSRIVSSGIIISNENVDFVAGGAGRVSKTVSGYQSLGIINEAFVSTDDEDGPKESSGSESGLNGNPLQHCENDSEKRHRTHLERIRNCLSPEGADEDMNMEAFVRKFGQKVKVLSLS